MKRCVLFIIFLTIFIYLCQAEGLHINFPQGSTTTLGVAHKSLDENEMIMITREQAAIFATKIDYSFCIFRMAYLDTENEGRQEDGSATFIVNVVADLSMLYDYVYYLQEIDKREFYGYHLIFYNLYEDQQPVSITDYYDDIEFTSSYLIPTGNTVTGVGIAQRSILNNALDEAFRFALSEISKYQDLNIKTMQQNVTEYSEQALLLNSENIVTDVTFSDIYIQQKFVDNLNYFCVKVMLKRVY